jgi:acyl carrier protein
LYVLDTSLKPVPPGVMGELYIGGAGVARGYLNRPELTAERFLPDTFSGVPGARLYKTGDLVRCRMDGVLEYLGRTDDQIKVRGYRIELGEIEAALVAHPKVQSCAVLAREDEPGNKQLVGYLISRGGDRPSTDDLRTFLKERLPEYMVPAQFVHLDSLPLTPNGKIDRKALPPPSRESKGVGKGGAPQTETAKAIAAIWSELLKADGLGINDDFFDLGGHSMTATALVGRLRATFGVEVSLASLFERPTIAGLSEVVDMIVLTSRGMRSGAGSPQREEFDL